MNRCGCVCKGHSRNAYAHECVFALFFANNTFAQTFLLEVRNSLCLKISLGPWNKSYDSSKKFVHRLRKRAEPCLMFDGLGKSLTGTWQFVLLMRASGHALCRIRNSRSPLSSTAPLCGAAMLSVHRSSRCRVRMVCERGSSAHRGHKRPGHATQPARRQHRDRRRGEARSRSQAR